MGCRLGFTVSWNTKLDLFITKNVALTDGIYSFVGKFKRKITGSKVEEKHVSFPYLCTCSNITASPAYGVYIFCS
jgi:hypothetical protein